MALDTKALRLAQTPLSHAQALQLQSVSEFSSVYEEYQFKMYLSTELEKYGDSANATKLATEAKSIYKVAFEECTKVVREGQAAYRASHLTDEQKATNSKPLDTAHYYGVKEAFEDGIDLTTYDSDAVKNSNYRLVDEKTNKSRHKDLESLFTDYIRDCERAGLKQNEITVSSTLPKFKLDYSVTTDGVERHMSAQDCVDFLSQKIENAKKSGAINTPATYNRLRTLAAGLNMDMRIFNGLTNPNDKDSLLQKAAAKQLKGPLSTRIEMLKKEKPQEKMEGKQKENAIVKSGDPSTKKTALQNQQASSSKAMIASLKEKKAKMEHEVEHYESKRSQQNFSSTNSRDYLSQYLESDSRKGTFTTSRADPSSFSPPPAVPIQRSILPESAPDHRPSSSSNNSVVTSHHHQYNSASTNRQANRAYYSNNNDRSSIGFHHASNVSDPYRTQYIQQHPPIFTNPIVSRTTTTFAGATVDMPLAELRAMARSAGVRSDIGGHDHRTKADIVNDLNRSGKK